MPVFELVLSRLAVTGPLALLAMLFAVIISIPFGIYAARHQNQRGDVTVMAFTQLGLATPEFWLGILLVLFFSVELNWFAAGGFPGWNADVWGSLKALLLPAFALGVIRASILTRLTRSSMLEVLGSEYVKLARLKGLPEALVIGKHAFKNALIPVLTLAGINLVIMVNVAVVVETVFAWPGIGRLLYEGIAFRDFPVVQATVLLGGTMIVVVNLLVDILYAVIDPRIRLER
jgi:peptide/nickel transport system permease protein